MTAAKPLLDVRDLVVSFGAAGEPAVRHVSLTVGHGEVVALVGESGSGKSVTVKSIMRLIDFAGGKIRGGQIVLRTPEGERDLAVASPQDMQRIRGARIAMIFQEPMTSLNPVLTIGQQLMEALLQHQSFGKRAAKAECIRLLDLVRITEPARRFAQYPHELSGGMRQRVMIAMALMCKPDLLIADEPTTALDVTVQAEILGLLGRIRAETGMAILFITHDMGVVAEIADRVVVMLKGEAVETGPVAEIFDTPQHPYTRTLLAAAPHLGHGRRVGPPRPLDVGAPVLEVQNLCVRYPVRSRLLRRHVANLHAVEDLSFGLARGETLAIVGESGCGKSTLAKTLLKLIEPASGRIMLQGRDMATLSSKELLAARLGIQMIFQDPYASLNPRMSIHDILAEPFHIHKKGSESTILDEICAMLDRVGLPESALERYPHQFSGGQRQRICIARALLMKPSVLIADEPVSALDVAIQEQILGLLAKLQAELDIAMLFISHDMAVVENISDRVAVMYRGSIVETGPTASVLKDARHPYTQMLLDSVPVHHPKFRRVRDETPSRAQTTVMPMGYVPDIPAHREISAGHFARI